MALGLTASLAVAAPAVAATTVRVSGGTTTLKLDGKTVKSLKKAGITVAVAKPAKQKRGAVALPIRSGAIDPATAKGKLALKGGLTLKMGKQKVTLAKVAFNSSKGVFTAKAGKKNVAFASAKGGKVTREGFATSAAGYKVAITKAGAAALNKAFGGKAVKAGAKLGTASIAPKTNEIAIARGTTTLAFAPQVAGALSEAGAAITPIAPATLDAATGALTLPVSGGTLNQRTLAGSISHAGGLNLGSFALTDVTVTLSASPTLSTNLGTIADLDISGLTKEVDPKTRTISLGNVAIRANSLAATTIDTAFFAGRGRLTAGTTLAVGSLQATAR